jgi:hypothetical protein
MNNNPEINGTFAPNSFYYSEKSGVYVLGGTEGQNPLGRTFYVTEDVIAKSARRIGCPLMLFKAALFNNGGSFKAIINKAGSQYTNTETGEVVVRQNDSAFVSAISMDTTKLFVGMMNMNTSTNTEAVEENTTIEEQEATPEFQG